MTVTISTTNRKFTDLDLSLLANPITGDVSKRIDVAAIKRSLVHLVNFRPYDIPFSPEISCQVASVLFEPDSLTARELIRTTIIQTITKFEDRVQIINVEVDGFETGYQVTINFFIRGSELPYSVSTLLHRTR